MKGSKNVFLDFENHMLNQAVSKKRLVKLRMLYRMVEKHTKKAVFKLTRKDIEIYTNKLNRNKITREDGQNYSGSTKSDIKKFLRQFFKWYAGDNEHFPKQVSWLRTKISKDELPKEKPVLSMKEIIKLSQSFRKPEFKIMTLILFDSGFRINELLNVKKKDLTFEQYDNQSDDKCFWIKCSISKTIPRKVPIPLFTEDLQNFVNTSYYQNLNNDELLFPVSYQSFLLVLRRNSKKTLGKAISPHCLRHSSATLYSKEYEGNMNLIGQRYGWSFSSKEMATYIRRSGSYEKIGAKKVHTNQLLELKRHVEKKDKEVDSLKLTVKVLTDFLKKEKPKLKIRLPNQK